MNNVRPVALCQYISFNYAQNFGKVKGGKLFSACPSMRECVRASVTKFIKTQF